jgi:flagellar biosynthesis GTPase FlhF
MARRKSYFANAVETALLQARQELGEETLLVESKRTGPEESSFGAYEVVVEAPEPHAAPALPDRSGVSIAPLMRDMTILKSELQRMSGLLAHVAAHATALPSETAAVAAKLSSMDLAADLAVTLTECVERRLGGRPAASPIGETELRRALASEIEARIMVAPDLGRASSERKVVALVGPPGSGKTTTLAKLAMQYGVSARRRTAIVTTDVYRVAAADQLRAYATILAVPFAVAETPAALARCLEEHSQKELILIDTAGFSPGDWDLAQDWAAALRGCPDLEVQLVLPATMRAADLERALERWACFEPSKLIFTRLDETQCAGTVVSAVLRTQRPLSFLCAGQAIPEDLEPATKAHVLALAMGVGSASALGPPAQQQAAAA